MNTLASLAAILSSHVAIGCGIVFILLVVEGEIVLVVSGILSHFGFVSPVILLPLLFVAACVQSVVWYSFGRFAKKHFKGKFFSFIETRVHKALPHLKEKTFWSIFFSKFIYGVSHLTLIFAGYTDLDYRKYIRAEILSSVIWVPLYFLLGYLFSFAAIALTKDIAKLAILIVVFIFVLIYVIRLLKRLIHAFFPIIVD